MQDIVVPREVLEADAKEAAALSKQREEKKWQRAFNKIEKWAKKTKYFEVYPGNFDAALVDSNVIVYNMNTGSMKNRIYSLLHECGHVLAMTSKGYKKKFPLLHKQRFGRKKINKNKNAYRIEILAEEIDAWKRGKKLAKRLGISLDKSYDDYAARWVMTYVRCA
tara:strand:+ start:401 stop:895 length:495 start_codon:yes stop_codon:yes gene_type:complete